MLIVVELISRRVVGVSDVPGGTFDGEDTRPDLAHRITVFLALVSGTCAPDLKF